MTTIAVVPEGTTAAPAGFRAVAGDKESCGPTVGAALDALSAHLPAGDTTLVVIQPMRGDEFFSDTDRTRLAALTARWRTARDAGGSLPPDEQAELDDLVAAELRAATARVAALRRAVP